MYGLQRCNVSSSSMKTFVLFSLCISSAAALICEPGWTLFKNNCYKHIVLGTGNGAKITPNDAKADCIKHGASLSSMADQDEMNFIGKLASRPGDWNLKEDALVVNKPTEILQNWPWTVIMGASRNMATNVWTWTNTQSTWVNWCRPSAEPTNETFDQCIVLSMQRGIPCAGDIACDNLQQGGDRYICKKPADCPVGAEQRSNGNCVCRGDYFDITDTDCPEGRRYEKGEMCIPRVPCQNVTSKNSLSIVFVVDSSQSIGERNWAHMVKFLKSGAQQLDNSIRVGFVQFSTQVTYSNWLPTRWTKEDYLDQTPVTFDAGYTNTPAALQEAARLLRSDDSQNQIAVLITDGMPYVLDILPQEEAMPKTIEAARVLRQSGASLVALGYGKELVKYQSYLKQILVNPRNDYFEYDKEAGNLRDVHMTVLLNKVCGRFQ